MGQGNPGQQYQDRLGTGVKKHTSAPCINYGTRARIGMLLPSSNQAAEPFFNCVLPRGVSLHTTRLKLTSGSESDLREMVSRVEDAAQLVVDAATSLVAFHCTAVSTFDLELEKSIRLRIERATGCKTVMTSDALVQSLWELGASRLVMVSPYGEDTNLREKNFFEAYDFRVLSTSGLNKKTAQEMMSVTPEEWQDLVLSCRNDNADAYVISCTAVRSAEVVNALELELGKPVITSNTAMTWLMLRALGIEDPIVGFGCLLKQH